VITLIAMAEHSQSLSFADVGKEVDIKTDDELEEFVIGAIREGAVKVRRATVTPPPTADAVRFSGAHRQLPPGGDRARRRASYVRRRAMEAAQTTGAHEQPSPCMSMQVTHWRTQLVNMQHQLAAMQAPA